MKKVLIANRGEIALRLVRACHDEGLATVGVYSTADRRSPHVLAADEAVEIGPPPAAESYLDMTRLLDAAAATGADAVHPGYGFLAERAEFADVVTAAGLTFIGPSAAAIRAMGEKTAARRTMAAHGVAVVPGTTEPVADATAALRAADAVGFPVLLKAVAGGGGKGMRRVDDADELRRTFERASSEARKAFGDGGLYVERWIERPRHIEIQVVADRHGRTAHLGERECSIQRRHQKLIEEAPSPVVTPELREAMGAVAVQAAQAVGYEGVGTVEFLLDRDGHFHFLEMNTRLQVEHPVTEAVYGIDLVREQLRLAAGGDLSAFADTPRGHAIECRITSEDPFDGFLPVTGTVRHLGVPSGPGVRWDGGIMVGTEVGLHYDPLLGKLIVWAETRAAAVARMRRALDELAIVGVTTSVPFHRRVMDHAAFQSGAIDIGFVDDHGPTLCAPGLGEDERRWVAVAAALAQHRQGHGREEDAPARGGGPTPWIQAARREGRR